MLVVVIGLTLALMIGQLFIDSSPDAVMPLGWPMALPALGTGIGLSPFARAFLPMSQASYDEFERAAITRAGSAAYVALLALVVAATAYCAWAEATHWPRPHRITDWLSWAIGLAVIGSNLPAAIAEFAIPFPDEDEPA